MIESKCTYLGFVNLRPQLRTLKETRHSRQTHAKPPLNSVISGENPAAMQTGTSSQRLQSPLPLVSVLLLLAVVQKHMVNAGAAAAETGTAPVPTAASA